MARTKKAETPQQRGARTRAKNKLRNGISLYVGGFASGYLLGVFDQQHGIPRTAKQVEKIAAAGFKSGL